MDDVTALALAARDGDRVALSSFVRQTWRDVSRLVTAVAGRDLAEDAAQDAYLRALRALPRFRGDASARTWLLSIARRAAVDAVRAAGRRRRLARLLSARVEPDGGTGLADGVLTEQAARPARPRPPGRVRAHPAPRVRLRRRRRDLRVPGRHHPLAGGPGPRAARRRDGPDRRRADRRRRCPAPGHRLPGEPPGPRLPRRPAGRAGRAAASRSSRPRPAPARPPAVPPALLDEPWLGDRAHRHARAPAARHPGRGPPHGRRCGASRWARPSATAPATTGRSAPPPGSRS